MYILYQSYRHRCKKLRYTVTKFPDNQYIAKLSPSSISTRLRLASFFRQPHRKMTSQEDTSQKDNLTRRGPQRKCSLKFLKSVCNKILQCFLHLYWILVEVLLVLCSILAVMCSSRNDIVTLVNSLSVHWFLNISIDLSIARSSFAIGKAKKANIM